ncbi:phosphoribosylanthranilate isomerase [Zhongshania guokunii]|uniref:N-(5'-phosphoribosyl)anthranilate isomerase n=1 Tax=Zhongshania guokunii TaxID=641783 RepID=A0ABV3UCM7_9GAMM
MSRTRVKICGITRAEDAAAAISAGADALGFVFFAKSPRALTAAQAALIIASLPPFVTKVGLFVNANADYVREVLAICSLDLLQFHGDETPLYCESFAKPYMKALRMREDIDLTAQLAAYSSASAVLLDSYKAGVPGGTGEVFDWERIPSDLSLPLVLAGGLRPNNAGAAIAACQPYALDVSGGVESAPGIKCADAITRFIEAVSAADRRED